MIQNRPTNDQLCYTPPGGYSIEIGRPADQPTNAYTWGPPPPPPGGGVGNARFFNVLFWAAYGLLFTGILLIQVSHDYDARIAYGVGDVGITFILTGPTVCVCVCLQFCRVCQAQVPRRYP